MRAFVVSAYESGFAPVPFVPVVLGLSNRRGRGCPAAVPEASHARAAETRTLEEAALRGARAWEEQRGIGEHILT